MLDLLFPNTCAYCERMTTECYSRNHQLLGSKAICDECNGSIRFIDRFSSCSKCGVPFGFFVSSAEHSPITHESENNSATNNHLCSDCLKGKFHFNKSRSVALYEGKIRDMIHKFKYDGYLVFGDSLSDVLVMNLPQDLDEFELIVPVPLYIGKLRAREFNHSAIFANALSRSTGVKCDVMGLKKIRETRPQFQIKGDIERRKNVKGAFSAPVPHNFRRKSVLIVDDVFTTGSTSDECAKILFRSGASLVQVLTIARAKAM